MKTLIVILALAIAVVWTCPVQALDTVHAQRALNQLKKYVGEPDGKIGPRTIRGIKEFQKSQDIPETGTLDPVTRNALVEMIELLEVAANPGSLTRIAASELLEDILETGKLDKVTRDALGATGTEAIYFDAASDTFETYREQQEKRSKEEPWRLVAGFFVLVVLLAIYFIPTIAAAAKRHLRWEAIFWLNLLLGWILIPWVIALCWALCPPIKPAEAAS